MWRIFLRPLPFLLSPLVRIRIVERKVELDSASCNICPRIFLGVVHAPKLFDTGSAFGYVRRFPCTRYTRDDSLMQAASGLVSLCASTIFTVTYGFDTAQIVSLDISGPLPRPPFHSCTYAFQGLTHIVGLVGSVVAILVAGPLGDWWIVWMSRRNRGIYEPEFRLFLMLSLLVGAFGYIGWAIGNDHHMPWVGAVACAAYVPSISAAPTTFLLLHHSGSSVHPV